MQIATQFTVWVAIFTQKLLLNCTKLIQALIHVYVHISHARTLHHARTVITCASARTCVRAWIHVWMWCMWYDTYAHITQHAASHHTTPYFTYQSFNTIMLKTEINVTWLERTNCFTTSTWPRKAIYTCDDLDNTYKRLRVSRRQFPGDWLIVIV